MLTFIPIPQADTPANSAEKSWKTQTQYHLREIELATFRDEDPSADIGSGSITCRNITEKGSESAYPHRSRPSVNASD